MAVTVINLTDPVQTLVTKTNTISTDLGDAATLSTGDDNAVDAINSLYDDAQFNNDSNKIISIAREGLSINNANAGGINLGYNDATGEISLTSNLVGGIGITYDSAVGNISITSLGVDTDQLAAEAVTAAKIGANAVTNDKIAANAVIDGKIADSAVGADELKSPVTLNIYDADSNIVKTLFGAGI